MLFRSDSSCTFEVSRERSRCRWGRLDGHYTIKPLCELPGEEADAGKEVPGESALMASYNPLNQSVHQPAVDLKKCSMIHAIVEAGSAIGERCRAPLRQCSWLLTGTALDQKLRSDERGNPLVQRQRQF